MAKVEIYTTMLCPFCFRAKKLLKNKGVEFIEFDVSTDPDGRSRMRQRAGGRNSVPQIFIDDVHVGGCDELHALEQRGELDPMLAG